MTAPIATLLRLACATAMLVSVAGPAHAGVIAQSVTGFEGGPALGSDGRVVVGERRGNGALAVLAVDPATTATTKLTAFAQIPDPATFSRLDIAGTGGIVTATRATLGTRLQLPFDVSALAVLPAVAPLAACSGPPRIGPNLEAAGGDGFVATLRADCGAGAPVVRIRTTNATSSIPLTPVAGERTFAPAMFGLRAKGPMVGWIETHYPGGMPASAAVVARAATGQVLLRVPIDPMFVLWTLGSDGTVVFVTGGCAMSVASPAAPAARTFTLAPQLCPAIGLETSPLSIAAGRVVYAASSSAIASTDRFAVTDLRGDAHALAESSTGPAGALSQTAFDGRTAYVMRIDCDADRLLALDADTAASLPPATLPTAERCPVRRAGSALLRVAPDRGVRVALRCPHGCRGTLRLVEQRRGRRERPVGQVQYATSAGTTIAQPQIAPYARALAGCAGGLRVAAILHPIGSRNGPATSDLGHGFGTFRIVSRSRCRHMRAPAFTKRQPGPRP